MGCLCGILLHFTCGLGQRCVVSRGFGFRDWAYRLVILDPHGIGFWARGLL